jgi:hypothetical protein
MSVYTDYIQSKYGDIITILSGTFNTSFFGAVDQLPDGRRLWTYDDGVLQAASSVINLQPLYDECSGLVGVSQSIIDQLSEFRTAEQQATPEYQSLLSAVKNAMTFLWGSFEDGGFAFIKIGDNIRSTITVSQVRGDTSRYYFGGDVINNGYDSLPRAALKECAFLREENNLILFMSDGAISGQYFTVMYPYQALDEWVYQYRPEYSKSVGTLMADSTWGSVLIGIEKYPNRGWSDNVTHTINVNEVPEEEIGNQGMYGGAEVDIEDNPNTDAGTSENEGGWGEYPSNTIGTDNSDMDDIGSDAINSGFVTLYATDKNHIKSFSNWLWTSITDSLADQIKRLMVNPLDGILFIAQTHLTVPKSSDIKEITFCGIGSGVTSKYIPKQHKTFHCGTVEIPKGDTNMFLDFQPYSKCEIYIPCIGYKELDVNDVIGSTITLDLQVDWVSGSLLAQLKMTRSTRCKGDSNLNNTLYEFQGNIYTNLPISASDWKSFYSNMLSFGNGMASALSGNIGSAISHMVSGVASQQVSVQKSGNISASYGYMGQQEISIFITRPNLALPDLTHYAAFNGWTCNMYKKLKYLKGYTEIQPDSLWIDTKSDNSSFRGITEEETEMLKSICNNGIYL